MSGADYYAAWKRGDLVPPIAETIDFELVDFGDGTVDVRCVPAEYHYSPYGMLHGGIAATLLDTVTGCAVHTRLAAGVGYATLALNVNYLRPITIETGPVVGRGSVTSIGKRVAVAEGVLEDAGGKRLALATSTCLIMS